MANSNVTGKVIGAIVVGTVIGSIIGLLFAPDKGSKTRTKIVTGAKDLSRKMREEANALINKAEELESMAEEKIHHLTNKVKEKVESYKFRDTKHETNNL